MRHRLRSASSANSVQINDNGIGKQLAELAQARSNNNNNNTNVEAKGSCSSDEVKAMSRIERAKVACRRSWRWQAMIAANSQQPSEFTWPSSAATTWGCCCKCCRFYHFCKRISRALKVLYLLSFFCVFFSLSLTVALLLPIWPFG